MGKKSRRQKQPAPPQPFHLRFEQDKITRHKDGSELSAEEKQRLGRSLRNARDTVDASLRSRYGRRYPIGTDDFTHDWLHEYTASVVYPRIQTKGLDSAIRALKRWPRLQPYWPRLRRRVCDHCHAQVALSEPRYLVCGGGGVARYCCEECQRNDWNWHQVYCADMARRRRIYEATKWERGL